MERILSVVLKIQGLYFVLKLGLKLQILCVP